MVYKDPSRKVKAALHSKFANGERVFAYVPLGYKRDLEKQNALVIDDETKCIVEKIFGMAYHGHGAASIAHTLIKEQIANWQRKMKDGIRQIFAGLVKCADCGWSMAYALKTQSKKPYAIYRCSNYGQGTGHCSLHYICYDVLYIHVLDRVRYWAKQTEIDEYALLQRLLKAGDREYLATSKLRRLQGSVGK